MEDDVKCPGSRICQNTVRYTMAIRLCRTYKYVHYILNGYLNMLWFVPQLVARVSYRFTRTGTHRIVKDVRYLSEHHDLISSL